MLTWPAKDPQEVADYPWTPPLDAGDEIDAITSADVIRGTIELGTDDKAPAIAGNRIVVWLSGGAAGETAVVRLECTTTGGRRWEEDIAIAVVERSGAALAEFRIRYPAFSAVTDQAVQYWLDEGGAQCARWPADNDRAALLYAAHKLTETRAGLAQGVTSFKSASFSADITSDAANRTGFRATQYGREYLDLARKHFAGGTMAWNPPACA